MGLGRLTAALNIASHATYRKVKWRRSTPGIFSLKKGCLFWNRLFHLGVKTCGRNSLLCTVALYITSMAKVVDFLLGEGGFYIPSWRIAKGHLRGSNVLRGWPSTGLVECAVTLRNNNLSLGVCVAQPWSVICLLKSGTQNTEAPSSTNQTRLCGWQAPNKRGKKTRKKRETEPNEAGGWGGRGL